MSIYDVDLDKTPANYQPLTPLSFLALSLIHISEPTRPY